MKSWGIVLVAVLALSGCSSSEADIPVIEDEVASGIEEQADLTGVTVDCPDEIEWEVGGEFHCFADDGTDSVRVTVHMENDAGEWSWVAD